MSETRIVDLAVPYRVDRTFHYTLDDDTLGEVKLGSVVQVSFNRKPTHAFVVGLPSETDVPANKLKPVESVLVHEPLFDDTMLRFLRWVASYYCHPLGEVIAAAIPRQFVTVTEEKKLKALESKPLAVAQVGTRPQEPLKADQLTGDQVRALEQILRADKPVLLHGVTGSGKTEVYLRALESELEQGRGGIILVPEIALTPQLLDRFSSRFPGLVSVLHSDLTPKERLAQWERLRRGITRVVVGARSAVFAPVKQLGLIIVDEEHEQSYKQEDQLRYHARDLAVVRAHFMQCRVILGSATPSLESYSNWVAGRYVRVELPERVHKRPMPEVEVVDLKSEGALFASHTPWLSRLLVQRIEQTLAAGKQSLLYLNRLGYAHFLYCLDCGHTWHCSQCDVSLTYYQKPPSLQCHYCGARKSVPTVCDACSGTRLDTLGVGTEQVENELKTLFPRARFGRMDRSVIKSRHDLEALLTAVTARQIDIIIGTQMLAKGHDFAGISLVGILMADATLNMPDFRANERTFQIITQVSGRAGRADDAGRVVLQTVNADSPVLNQAIRNDSDSFYQAELAARAAHGFPPAERLAMLRFQHRNSARVREFAVNMVEFLSKRNLPGVQLLGPAEAPLSRIKGLYRWHCLVKSPSVAQIQQAVHLANAYRDHLKVSVQMAVDMDPVNCM